MNDILDRCISPSQVELLVVELPQWEPFQSAIGWRHSREALLIRWTDHQGNWGIGECSCRPDPFFSHEYLAGAEKVIQDFILPNLPAPCTYDDLIKLCRRIRGWNFAKGALFEAVHDLWRRAELPDPIDAWQTPKLDKVPVGISLGLYSDGAALADKVGETLEAGYRRVKMKIKPGLPQSYLVEVRKRFPNAYLGVDANGSFDDRHIDELHRLADLGFDMIEQPFSPDRLDLCARLKREQPRLRICLDESVESLGNLISAHRLNALDELNIKPGRVGGPAEAINLARYCMTHQIPVWIGGMFESGIGRAANLRFAACFPSARGHDLSPSKRYFKGDLVAKPLAMDKDGMITVPSAPISLNETNLDRYLMRRTIVRKNHA